MSEQEKAGDASPPRASRHFDAPVGPRQWIGRLRCADCGAVLNETIPVSDADKAICAITSGFVAGQCPNGCRSTFSDMNINTKLEWEEVRPNTRV